QEIEGPSSPDGPHTIQVANSDGQNLSKVFTTPLCNNIGVATQVQGTVTVTRPDGTSGPLHAGDPVKKDDKITTGPDGRVTLLLDDNTSLVVSINSSLTLDEYVYDP